MTTTKSKQQNPKDHQNPFYNIKNPKTMHCWSSVIVVYQAVYIYSYILLIITKPKLTIVPLLIVYYVIFLINVVNMQYMS